jgi:ABC-2 type transport system ATP-binding protein
VLEVTSLKKTYGRTVAVESVNLRVETGSCFGLLGPNGAGKTTVISIIAGTLRADSGEVRLDGERLTPDSQSVKRKIGYVPQDLALFEELSAVDNLKFFGMLYGITGGHLRERMNRVLEDVRLQDRQKGPVKEFSGGMKRRLNIAAALLHEPDFLILDEPTVGVDPQSRNAIFETLEVLMAAGKTVLYTTHYMEEVERLCDRAAIIDAGNIIAEGDLASLHKLAPHRTVVIIELDRSPRVDFSGLKGMTAFVQKGRRLSVELEDLNRDLSDVLMAIRSAGERIDSVQTMSPTLEEVFLHLTGRVLRD